MATVYSAANITLVSVIRSVLEGHGIRCWVRNEFISAGVGDIPPIECWPQLCVGDDDFLEATRIVAEALAPENQGAAAAGAWLCGSCGEHIEGQFGQCWKCGASAPKEKAD
jgi:hypothetical protein